MNQLATQRWFQAVVIVLALLAATALLHPEQFAGKIYASSDASSAEAFRMIGTDSMEAGEYPLWNPFVFVGMPGYASMAYTPGVYPLEQPVDRIAKALGMPPMTWLLFHVLLTGVFTAGYLRWRGHSLAAAVAGGALLIAMPTFMSWCAYGHGTKVLSFAWVPLILWCLEGVLRRGGLIYVFGLAAALSVALLRAHPQIIYYAAIAGVFWYGFFAIPLLRDVATRRRTLVRTALLILAALLALGASMVLYLPVLEYDAHSIRGASSSGGGVSFEYATGWSLSIPEIATLWWPTAAGYGRASYVGSMPFTDYPNYVGAPLLVLGLLALLLRRDRWSVMLLCLGLFSTLVALGKHSFVYGLLFEALPGFKKFRVPVMILIIQQLATVMLAVAGIDAVLAELRKPVTERARWLGRPLVLGLGIVGLGLLIMGTAASGVLRENSMQSWSRMREGVPFAALETVARMASHDALRLGLVILASLATFVAFARRRVPAVLAAGAVGIVLFVDLYGVDRPIVHPERYLKGLARGARGYTAVEAAPVVRELQLLRDQVAPSELVDWLKQQEPRPRIWPVMGFEGENVFAAHGIVSLGGYHAAKLKLYEDLRSRLYQGQGSEVSRLIQLLAAGWVVAPTPLGPQLLDGLRGLGVDLELAHEGNGGVAYRIREAGPRAWLAYAYELEEPGLDTTAREPAPAVLDRVLLRGFDPARVAILSDAPLPAPRPSEDEGAVRVVEEGFHHLLFETRSAAPRLLVTADIWYPGWRVSIDGEPARLLRANYALRAVAVPPGTHSVRFEFHDEAYGRGRAISRASAAIMALGLLAGLLGPRLRRRRAGV